jgi:hypothetical protein
MTFMPRSAAHNVSGRRIGDDAVDHRGLGVLRRPAHIFQRAGREQRGLADFVIERDDAIAADRAKIALPSAAKLKSFML